MIAIQRANSVSKSMLAILCLAGGLGACTSQEVNNGDGGTGKGGSTGAAGSAGSTGTGGGSDLDNGVACLPIGMALITDFTYDPDGGATDSVRWGNYGTTLSGGVAKYPDALTGDVTTGDWHLKGTIADYAGFNIYFDAVNGCNKFDASAYAGISFTIWGTIGATAPNMGKITMGASTVDDNVKPEWLVSVGDTSVTNPPPGRCMPTAGNGQYYHPGCSSPTYLFAVTGTSASPQTVSVKWSDFTGGAPKPGVSASEITSVNWQLPVPTGVGMAGVTVVPYDVDLHIDNLKFIAK